MAVEELIMDTGESHSISDGKNAMKCVNLLFELKFLLRCAVNKRLFYGGRHLSLKLQQQQS